MEKNLSCHHAIQLKIRIWLYQEVVSPFHRKMLKDSFSKVSVSVSFRLDHVIESQNAAVKKVPIRIVHSEGITEKENCPFLQHSEMSVAEAEGPDITSFGNLGAARQDSVFCAFTRQREANINTGTQVDPKLQKDSYMTTGEEINSNSQQPLQPTDVSHSNQATETIRLSEEQKREELARDIMGKDKSLADILDQSKMKTTMDLMEGIFPQGEQLLEGAHQRRKVPSKQTVSRPAEERSALVFSLHSAPERWSC